MRPLKEKTILWALVAGLPVAVTWPLILRLNSFVYGNFFGTDMRGAVWSLWWRQWALRHNAALDPCPFVAAPFGAHFDAQPIFWMVGFLLNGLLRLLDPVAVLNILLLLSFALTYWATFKLARYLTGNFTAACLSAGLFTYAPYHLNKVAEFGFFLLANWFVLYVFALFKLHSCVTGRRVLAAGLALAATASFNFYYALFAVILTLSFMAFRWFRGRRFRKEECPQKTTSPSAFALAVLAVFCLSFLIDAPSIVPLMKKFFSLRSLSGVFDGADGYIRPFSYLTAQSARPLSYLLPAWSHPVFGDGTRKMFGSFFYGRGPIEQTLYVGWVPLAMAYFAYRLRKQRLRRPDTSSAPAVAADHFHIDFLVFLACIAFIFSMPPVLDLGFFTLYFPGYFLYKILPMFRAYARFGMMVMLAVSLLAGYGLRDILDRIRRRNIRFLFLLVVFSAILFEFTNVPPSRVTDISKVPDVYAWLAGQEGDLIVAEYPMVLNPQGEAQENYDYLFEQTRHRKRLMNGILQGSRGAGLKDKIVKIENPDAPVTLLSLGVKYVILHEDLYREGGHRQAVDVIGDVPAMDGRPGFKRVKTFKDVSVFEIVETNELLG